MPTRFPVSLLLALSGIALGTSAEPAKPSGSPSILPSSSRLEELWNQGEFTEGVAVAADGSVYFSDIPSGEGASGKVYKFDPKTGKTTVHCAASGKSNGLMFDRAGRLIACCGANNGLMALCEILPNGKLKLLTGRYNGGRYLSPNDLVILPDGKIYFSDPRYVGGEKEEQDQMAVYRYDPVDGSVQLAIGAKQIEKPNGLALSPDGNTLYVAENNNAPGGRMTLNAFRLRSDGSLGPKKVIVDFGDEAGIDGMTVDVQGNIYAAVRSARRFGIVVYTDTGRELARIPTATLPTNCCFGTGADANVLYITAGGGLYRIPMNVAGHHPATAPQAKSDWVPLFDGQSAKGWTPRGQADRLEAVNGELHLFSTVNVWVVSDVQMADFEVEVEVKLPEQAAAKEDHFNSGLGFRLFGETGKPKGYQCEIERESAGKNGGVYGIGLGGWLFPKGAKQTAAMRQKNRGLFRDDKWNKFRVRAVGPRIQTWINGRLISDLEDGRSLRGRFGIQHHGSGGVVRFRNLRARPLGSRR